MEAPSWSYNAVGKANHIGQHSTVVDCEKKISVWIHDCARNHPKCAQKATTRLPGRVIDLRNGPSMISLLEPGEMKGKYINLSHCWGSGGTQVKTTKANLSQFQRQIPDEMLCKTYRDVIALSHALGITFLWIDSLCIIQDDPAEWDAESGNMAYIYENSYLTICATRSEDGNGGLFGDRYLDRKDVESIEQAGPQYLGHLKDSRDSERQNGIFGRLEFEHHSGGKGGNEYSSTPGFERPLVEPLMLRAWAFQERLLSYRTVDFLSGEMVRECRESQRCECTQADRRDQVSRTTEKKIFSDFKLSHTNDPGISEERSNEILLLDIWERIVTAYTELRLTFGSDKLPALSGLAQRIVSKIPETQGGLSSDLQPVYIAGLWRDFLPYQLLWYPVRRTTYSFMETIGERSSDFRAPSFSWASNNGVIKFHEIPRGAKSTPSVRIVDIEYSFRGSDPFGHCRSGKLIICGPLVRGKIEHENKNGSDPFLIFAPECIVANGKKLMWWPDELISDPKRKSFIPKGSEIFCLEILWIMPSTTYFRSGQSKLPAMIFGLVLEHIGGDGAFRRLGMCCERMEDGGIFSFGEEDTIHII